MRQQQPAVGSSTSQLALFSPMGRDPTTTAPPQSPVAPADESETELEVSSSPPSKMMLTTADDGDRTSHISEEPLMSSGGLKLRGDSPPARIRPNQKKKDASPTTTPVPPKKISSTKKKKTNVKSSKRTVKKASSSVKKGFTLPSTKDKKTRAKKKTPTTQTQTGVESPSDVDVLCGRGSFANNHKGNMQFRNYVMQLRCVYQQAEKAEKTELAKVSVLIFHLASLIYN